MYLYTYKIRHYRLFLKIFFFIILFSLLNSCSLNLSIRFEYFLSKVDLPLKNDLCKFSNVKCINRQMMKMVSFFQLPLVGLKPRKKSLYVLFFMFFLYGCLRKRTQFNMGNDLRCEIYLKFSRTKQIENFLVHFILKSFCWEVTWGK